jgi:hypothetical protein
VKFVRPILIVFFAVSLFIGSSGIHVFEHFCKVDGTDYSFFIPPTHSCKTITKVKSCCEEQNEKEDSFKDNCCDEDLISFQITSDFIQKEFQKHTEIYFSSNVKTFNLSENFSLKQEQICQFPTNRPPPKTGQEILILHQVFRI